MEKSHYFELGRRLTILVHSCLGETRSKKWSRVRSPTSLWHLVFENQQKFGKFLFAHSETLSRVSAFLHSTSNRSSLLPPPPWPSVAISYLLNYPKISLSCSRICPPFLLPAFIHPILVWIHATSAHITLCSNNVYLYRSHDHYGYK